MFRVPIGYANAISVSLLIDAFQNSPYLLFTGFDIAFDKTWLNKSDPDPKPERDNCYFSCKNYIVRTEVTGFSKNRLAPLTVTKL